MAQNCVNANAASAILKITSIFISNTNKAFATKLCKTIKKVIRKPNEIYDTITDEIDDGKSLLFCGNIIEIMGILMQHSPNDREKILYQSKCNADLFFNKPENISEKQMHVKVTCSSQNVTLQSKKSKPIKANFGKIAYKTQYSAVRIAPEVSTEISDTIRESIPHIYNHMIKSCAFHRNNEFTVTQDSENLNIKIFNYGFHNNTNEQLYCVAKTYNQCGYNWTMTADLYTTTDIENEFDISADRLPQFIACDPKIQTELQRNKDVINFENIINKTKWHKREEICVYNKRNNTNRKTLCFSKPEFVKRLKEAYNVPVEIPPIIPILMPNQSRSDNGHHIEFVQILRIQSGCDIGLSYKYNETKKQILPCGIHLDGEFIRSQHQLLVPNSECVALDNFVSNIDYLSIGNPDYFENNMNRCKTKSEKFVSFLTKSIVYFREMISNGKNMTDDNIKIWIDKAVNALSNDKNVNYFLDVSKLLLDSKYVKDLQDINNFYYIQTLSPIRYPIVPHPIHQCKHQSLIIPPIMMQ